MCGISGLIFSETRRESSALKRMTESIRHRGPDDYGWALERDGRIFHGSRSDVPDVTSRVYLGHRRLSIQDLSAAGVQPMVSSDGDLVIVFNGEIYNFLELRSELESLGQIFKTGTDTEVLLASFRVWGESMLSRLIGMFAFAIWDRALSQVFFARDPAGIKPLYYTLWGGGFAFASEIKALMTLPGISRVADRERVFHFLRFGITDHDEGTMFSAVKQLLPGSSGWLSVNAPQSLRFRRYFHLSEPDIIQFKNEDEAAECVRQDFLKSVELHLRSDVPVGVALSGGIDSTAITMAVRNLRPHTELHSFSFAAIEPSVSEEKWIDLAVQSADCIAHKVRPTPAELIDDFDEVIYAEDHPSADFGIYPQHRVARLARENNIKVLLSGEGGDELFAGYTGYAATRFASQLLRLEFCEALKFAIKASQLPGRQKLWLEAAQYLIPYKLQGALRKIIGRELLPDLMNRAWFEGAQALSQPIASGRRTSLLRDVLDQAISSTTLPHLLRYQDRASMCYSVESRVPFLTGDFIQSARRLPERYLIGDSGIGKHVFIKALRGLVPDVLLDRKDKAGFDMAKQAWVNTLGDFIESIFTSDRARACTPINHASLISMWIEVRAGRRVPDAYVWRCLNFIAWADRFEIEFE